MVNDKDVKDLADLLLKPSVEIKKQASVRNDISYINACEEIANEILSLNANNNPIKTEVLKIIKSKSAKYKLSRIPKNIDILKLLPEDNHFKKLLKLKPSKTSSGIAVITVMPMPFECPHGKCIYCPGGIEVNTPLSYIGTEPVYQNSTTSKL